MSGTGEVSVSQKGLSPREDGKKVPMSIFAPETEHAYTEMRVGAESLQGGGWGWSRWIEEGIRNVGHQHSYMILRRYLLVVRGLSILACCQVVCSFLPIHAGSL